MNEKRKFNRTIKLSLFALFIFVFVLFAINIPKTLGIYKESKEIVTNVNITKEVYTITLNNQSATTAGSASIYAKYDQGYYTDDDALNQMTTNANAITVPVRTGYTFDGYYTLANGGVKYIDENGYLTSNASTTQFSANGNLYAHWIKSADNLTVTVNPSSYIYNGNAQTPNVTVKDLLTNLTENTDYTVSVDEDTNVGTSTITITMSNIYNSTTKSYYSGTTTITYTINNAKISTYDGNTKLTDFYVRKNSNQVYDGLTSNTTTTMPIASKTGYTFDGYYTSESGGTKVINANGSIVNGVSNWTNSSGNFIVTADETLYARFTEHSAELTYDSNGHGTAPSAVTMLYTLQTKAAAAISSTGYTFNGWNTESNGSGTTYQPNDVVKAVNTEPVATTLYAMWSATPYSISYTLNGGTNSINNPSTYTIESSSITLEQPTKTGYIFSGWTGSNGNTPQVNVTIATGSTGNKSYTANWVEKSSVVTYYNGGHGTAPSSGTMKYTESYNAESGISATGYTFVNWNTSADGTGTSYAAGALIKDVNIDPWNLDLYAIWSVDSYNITYTLNDGTNDPNNPSTYTIESSDITLLPPTRANYQFAGWTGSNGNVPETSVTIATGSTGDKTFEANWTGIIYTLTFNKLNGSGGSNAIYEKYNDGYFLDSTATTRMTTSANPIDIPTRSGYRFTGYYTKSSGGTRAIGQTGYRTSNVSVTTFTADTTLYARWYKSVDDLTKSVSPTSYIYDGTAKTPTVTLTDGSSNLSSTSYNVSYSDNTDVGTATVTVNGASKYFSTTKAFYDGTTTLTFYINNATLNLYSDSNNYDTVYVRKGETGAFTAIRNSTTTSIPIPSKTGYTFTGYYTAASGGTKVINADGSIVASVTDWTDSTSKWLLTTNENLYAQYTPTSYTISYNLDGGTVASANPETYTIESSAITLNNPTKPGYTFKGWSGTDLTGDTNTTVTIASGSTGNRTYTANWTKNTYTITYDLDGGTVATANPTSYSIDTADITLNNPTKPGYTFAGWTEKTSDFDWFKGFINASTGVLEKNSNYPNSYFTDYVFIKSGVAYTVNDFSPYSASNIRWRVFNVDETYRLNGPSSNTYTPASDAYVRIMFFYNPTSASMESANITNSAGTTATIPTGSLGNKEFTATWTPNTYTLTVDAQGGTIPTTSNWTNDAGDETSTKTVTYASTYGNLPSPTRTGYSFAGWYSNTNANRNISMLASASSTHYYKAMLVIYPGGSYTIKIGNASVTAGSATQFTTAVHDATAPRTYSSSKANFGTDVEFTRVAPDTLDPTHRNLILIYSGVAGSTNGIGTSYQNIKVSTDGGNAYSSSSTVSVLADHTIYAHWDAETYNVTLNKAGGSGGTGTIYERYDDGFYTDSTLTTKMTTSANAISVPTKNGYEFKGYYTGQNGTGTKFIEANGKLSSSASASQFSDAGTLYAYWTPMVYHITLDNQSATTSGTTDVYYEYNTTRTIGTLKCYYYSDANLQNCLTGGYYIDDPTKTGYDFDGYYTETSGGGTAYVRNDGAFINSIYKTIGDRTLYANWIGSIYTITLNKQDGSSGVDYVYEKYNDGFYTDSTATTKMTTSANAITVPTRSGYTFDGYYTAADGGTKYIDANGKLTSNASTTQFNAAGDLYAHWIKNASSLNITGISASYIYNESAQTPVPTVKDGSTSLTSGTDYTVSYSSNTNVGTATVTITGSDTYNSTTKAYYTGTTTVNFYINNAKLTLYTDTNITEDVYVRKGTNGAYTAVRSSTAKTIPIPSKTGYTFNGYFTQSSNGTKVINTDRSLVASVANWTDSSSKWLLTSDNTLYAQFSLITYNITYDLDGGSHSGNPATYNIESGAITLNEPTKTGYTFLGWTGSNGSTPQTTVTIAAGSTGDKSYTANWEANTYQITYDYKNTSTTYNVAGDYDDTGYVIDWDKTFTITGQIMFPTSAKNYIIFSNYPDSDKAIRVEVDTDKKVHIYQGTDTTGDVSSTTIGRFNSSNWQTYTFNWNADTKTYTFIMTESTYTNISMTGTFAGLTGTATNTVRIGRADYRSDLSSFATTTYGRNLAITTDYVYGGNLDVPTPVARIGYNFNGWFTAASGGTQVTSSTPMPSANTTYYGRYTGYTYYVSYNANGGSGTMSDDTFVYGTSKTLTQNAFTREGYEFASWNLNAAGTSTMYFDKQSQTTLTRTENGTVTLYSMWRPTTYTIAYDANGGTGTMASKTASSGVATTLDANTYTKPGYTFAGWTDGTNTYTDQDSVTINSNYFYNVSNPTLSNSSTGSAGHWYKGATTKSAITDSPSNDLAYMINIPQNTTTSTKYILYQGNVPLLSSNTYTVSVWAKGTGSLAIRAGNGTPYYEETFVLSNTWTKYTMTFNAVLSSTSGTGNARSSNHRTQINFSAAANSGPIQIAGMKLEKGSSATPFVDTNRGTNTYTLKAIWNAAIYTITLNKQNGSGGVDYVYEKYNDGYYTDSTATTQMTTSANAISVPTRSGYTFDGYYTAADGGVQYIDANGKLTSNASTTQFTGPSNLYAHWIKNASSLTVTGIASSYIYNGSAQTPAPTVKDGSTTLTSGTHYTVSYSSNTNVGTATVTITGSDTYNATTKAFYTGTKSVNFYINNVTLTLNTDTNSSETTYVRKGTNGAYTAIRSNTTTSIPLGSKTGYTFNGYFTSSSGGTKVVNSDGSLVASVANWTDSSSKWLLTADSALHAQYTPTSYTITYDLDGGSVASANPETYTIESSAITLNNPTKSGYTFKGWSGTGLTGDANTTVTIASGSTGNRTYTANWTKESYTITYNLDGGKVSPANPTTYAVDTATFTLTNPTKLGYTFTGWTGSNGNTPQTTVSIAVGSTGNKTYTANWTANTYTVTANSNGGNIPSTTNWTGSGNTATKSVTYNAAYGNLLSPTKTGYSFAGWSLLPEGYTQVEYIQSSGTQYINTNVVPTNTLDVRIHYVDTAANNSNYVLGSRATSSSTVIYAVSGSSSSQAISSSFDGNSISYPITRVANKEYIIALNVEYDATNGYRMYGVLNNVTDSVIYDGYTSYSQNGITGDPATIKVFGFNSSNIHKGMKLYSLKMWDNGVLIRDYVPCINDSTGKAGLYDLVEGTFYGSANSANFTAGSAEYITSSSIVTLTTNHDIYAHWDAESYNVTLNKAGGSGGTGTIYEKYADGFYTDSTLTTKMTTSANPISVPSKTGYTFNGYYTGQNGAGTKFIEADGKLSSTASATQFSDAGTLYAYWTPITYNITYTLNGGTNDANNPATYNIESAAITLAAPTKTNYTFAGWTGSNGSTPQTTVTIASGSTGDKTYEANWAGAIYTITLNKQSGSSTSSYIYEKYGDGFYTDSTATTKMTTSTNAIASTTRSGYTFDGYYTAANGGTQYINSSGNITSSASNTNFTSEGTLYAHWKKAVSNLTSSLTTTSYIYDGTAKCPTATVIDGSTSLTAGTHYTIACTSNTNVGTATATITGSDSYFSTTKAYYTGTKDLTFYINNATLNLYKDGSVYDTIYVRMGQTGGYSGIRNSTTKSFPAPNKDGYTFNGWYTEGGVKVVNADGTIVASVSGWTDANKKWLLTADNNLYANYTAITYNITTDLDGGSVSTANPTTYTIESSAITLNNPTKTGYTFLGWTGSNGENPETTVTIPAGSTGDKSYTANWDVNTYTITYDYRNTAYMSYAANEIENTGYLIDWDHDFTITGQYRFPTASKKYILVSNGSDGATTLRIEADTDKKIHVYMGNDIVTDVSSTTIGRYGSYDWNLTFNWNASTKTYTLVLTETTNTNISMTGTYSSATGTSSNTLFIGRDDNAGYNTSYYSRNLKITKDYEYGGTLDNPTPVVRLGYTYNGWFTATSGGSEVTNSTSIPAADTTYYAQYTGYTYYVRFNANGGTGTMNDQTFTYGASTKALTTNAFARENYEFLAWNTNSGGTSTMYEDKRALNNLTKTQNGIFNLYAMWRPTTYNIVYDANGGSGTMSNQTATYGTSATLTTNAYTKSGYTFGGWTDGYNVYTDQDSVNINSNGLYAVSNPTVTTSTTGISGHWTKNSTSATKVAITNSPSNDLAYMINIPANGSTSTRYVQQNNVPVKPNQSYTVSVWAKGSGTLVIKAGSTTPSKTYSVTLTDSWTLYQMKIDTITGSTASGDNVKIANERTTIYYGTTAGSGAVQLAGMKLEKGTTATAFVDTNKGNNTYTLKAIWTPNIYTITLNKDGGTSGVNYVYEKYDDGFYTDSTATTKMTTSSNAITVPTKTGYTFNGYYTGQNGTGTKFIESDGKLSSSASATQFIDAGTLYAYWTPITYNITYTLNGGTNNANNPATYNVESSAITLQAPTKTGYAFAGWTGSNGNTPQTTVTIAAGSTGDKSYTANWTANIYRITLNKASGSGGFNYIYEKYADGYYTDSTATTQMTTSTNAITIPTRSGYVFKGYYTGQNGTGVQYVDKDGHITSNASNTNFTAPGNLYAYWEEKYAEFSLGLNVKMKVLAGNANATSNDADTNITAFTRSTTPPSAANMQEINRVDSENSNVEIYMWYSNGTIYYYADADVVYLQSGNGVFYNMNAITSIDLTGIDTSHVDNMSVFFAGCSSLTSLTFGSGFDTSGVLTMKGMFRGCSSLTSLNLSSFNTSNVTNMNGMFKDCTLLTSINLSTFNTSSVTDMASMFSGVYNLTTLDVSSFNTSNVTDMSHMFYGMHYLTTLTFGNYFNTSNVTNMAQMFGSDVSLANLDVSGFNTSKVTDMNHMFGECRALTSIDVSNFDTHLVTNMEGMFIENSGLTELDITSFSTPLVENMSYMFYGDTALKRIYAKDTFVKTAVTNSANMFRGDELLEGGRGTKYSSSYQDGTRAQIDGGSGNEGYFTDPRVACKGNSLSPSYSNCYKTVQALINDNPSINNNQISLFQNTYEDITIPAGTNTYMLFAYNGSKVYGNITNNNTTSGRTFTLANITVNGTITNSGTFINIGTINGRVVNSGTFTLSSGTINLDTSQWLFNNSSSSSVFNMTGGTINHTNAGTGSTVYNNGGTLNITGGTINSSGFGVVNHGGTASLTDLTITMDTGSYAAVLNRNNGATTLLRSTVTGTINNEVDNPDKLRFFESTLVTGGITGKAVYRKAVYWNGDYLSQWRLYGYNDTTLFNTHVAFPTWTSANGQDDLTWNDAYGPNQVTDSTGTFFYYNVQRSDHNNELGEYVTHVYVYPLSGSMYSVGAYTYNYPTTANG